MSVKNIRLGGESRPYDILNETESTLTCAHGAVACMSQIGHLWLPLKRLRRRAPHCVEESCGFNQQMISTDDGATWGAPSGIDSYLGSKGHAATGPGVGIERVWVAQ